MISVIIAAYNRADLLGRAIKSVLSQKFDDYEIVIVDDCSSDNTEQVVKSFKSEKIRYVRLNENSGSGKAKNIGVSNAKGEFVTFLDSDDYYYDRNVLGEISRACQKADVVSYRQYCIETGNNRVVETAPIRGDAYQYMMEHPLHYMGKPPYAINKKVFEDAGGLDTAYRWGEGVGLWRRIFRDGASLVIVEGLGYVMVNHGGERVSRGDESVDRRKGKRIVFNVFKAAFDEQADYFNRHKVIKAVWLILLLRISKSMRDQNLFFQIGRMILENGLRNHFKAYYLLKTKKICEG